VQTMNITPLSRNNRHLILFKVDPYNFCAPAAEVESIIMLPPVSRLPKVPPSVIGLINHRGQVYRVISLRRKLGLETGPPRMEGQLILTRLPTGLTAFLVDEVMDVLPDTNLSRRPLSPHSPMDLFDAFILRDEQVLFHTTFNLIDQAGEAVHPNPDLKTMERMTAEALVQINAPDRSTGELASTALDEGETNGAAAPEQTLGRDGALRPMPAIAKNLGTSSKTGTARPRVARADRFATIKDHPHTSPEPTRETPAPRRPQSAIVSKRARRYAVALTALLLLLLVVTLSSSLLLKQTTVVSQPQQTGAPIAPPPAIALTKEHSAPSQETRRPPSLVKDAPKEAPPHAASNTPQTASPSTTVAAPPAETPTSPEATPIKEPSPPQDTANENVVIIPEETPRSFREVLRMETETFTLMVERPAAEQQSPAESLSNQVPPANAAIVHRVIPGDTLWDIAEHYLDDPFQYPELARLSQIRNPDLIYPGDIIRIIKKAQ
jgi:chemotaxis signal transduction protein/nucleoid-associated protein YgaU